MQFEDNHDLYEAIKPDFDRAFRKYALSPAQREDLFHDAFEAYLRARRDGRFDPAKGNAQQYMIKAGRYLYFKSSKRGQRETLMDEQVLEFLQRHEVEDGWEAEANRRRLHDEILPALSDVEKEILWQSLGNGWPLQEVADYLGKSLGAVKMKKRRALDRIRAMLQQLPKSTP